MKRIMIGLALLIVLGGAGYYAFASNSKKSSEVKQTSKQVNSNKNENSNNHKAKKTIVKPKAKATNKKTGSEDLIPKEYQGNWYTGNKLFCTITSNEIDVPNSEHQKKITKDSSPLKLPSNKNDDGSYTINTLSVLTYAGGEPNYYWLSTLTINGKKESVIVGAGRQQHYMILTRHPTDKDYSFFINDVNAPELPIGVKDMDDYYSHGENLDDYSKKMQDEYDTDSEESQSDSNNDSNSENPDTNE